MTNTMRLSAPLSPTSKLAAPTLGSGTLRALAVGVWAALLCPHAQAVSLGEASTRSAIGEMLRIEIPVRFSASEQIDASCVRLLPQPADDMSDVPWVTQGSVQLHTNADGVQTLVINARPVRHPVAMLSVSIQCGAALRRDYALLLEPPRTNAPTLNPVTAPSESIKAQSLPPASADSAGKWVVASGQSPALIARALYPRQRSAQQRLLTALYAANPSLGSHNPDMALPVGSELSIPRLTPPPATTPARPVAAPVAPVVARARPEQPPAPAAVTPQADDKPRRAAAPGKRDRLLVSESGEGTLRLSRAINQRPELSETERTRLKSELGLIAELDDKNVEKLELKDRLHRLETLQARLSAEAQRLEAELRATEGNAGNAASPVVPTQEALQAPTVATASTPPSSVARTPVITLPAPAPRASAQPDAGWLDWRSWAIGLGLAAAVGVGAFLLHRRRAAQADAMLADDMLDPGALHADLPMVPAGDPMMEPLTEADIWPDEPAAMAPAAPGVRAVDGAIGPLSTLDDNDPVTQTAGEEEYDSAVELADIMMSFGRVQGAAQTLADYIRANPKQAVKPWIKLLEVYRSANMRVEFEGLTAQLNKTFNVQPVAWDDFEVAMRSPDSLESLTHIANKLCELWGQRACQAYLHDLLRDNRKGTRQGFPLVIIDEILLLLAILESSLGVYRPDSSADMPAIVTSAPGTAALASRAPVAQAPAVDLEAPTISLPVLTPPSSPPATPALTPAVADFDFDLMDMDLLSKTLHINLDELAEADDTATPHAGPGN